MSVRNLSMSDLREVVDRSELSKGQVVLDSGGLAHLAVYSNKIFAEVKGSRGSGYRTTVSFGDRGQLRGKCSCRASWSRPFCKHAAALLLAWSRKPEAFVATEGPADEPRGGKDEPGKAPRKRAATRGGKRDAKVLMKAGAEQVSTLVRELAVTGVGGTSAERLEQLDELARNLRELRLRRLSGRALGMVQHLRLGAERFSSLRHATLLCDMLLTAAKITAHCEGKTLDDRYVEELIGKTWRKPDRRPVEGLVLLQYAYSKQTTADSFRVCESRFVDLESGEHYTERQILPAHIAKTTAPKLSYAGKVLDGARGGIFPGFSPLRLYLEGEDRQRPVTEADLQRLLGQAASIEDAMARFQEHRKDVFAPDRMPVMVRATGLVAHSGRLRGFDDGGATLHLHQGVGQQRLADALEGRTLLAFIGELDLHHAIPTLWPSSLLVQEGEALALHPAGRARRGDPPAPARRAWAEVAREAGLSYAAVSVGEVREELADLMSAGLSGLDARAAEPLRERLVTLKLAKQAALLEKVVAEPDPLGRVGGFVKLFQVLGVALVRLAGVARVEREGLLPVPTHVSIYISEPERALAPAEVATGRVRGTVTQFEAAVHYHRYYRALRPEQMAADRHVLADGGAMPYVIEAIVQRPELALSVAEAIFAVPMGKVALRTAFGLLARSGLPEGELALKAFSGRRRTLAHQGKDVTHMADDALIVLQHGRHKLSPLAEQRRAELEAKLPPLLSQARSDSDAYQRELGCEALASLGSLAAAPDLREILRHDKSKKVRAAAAMALAALGDVRSTELLLERLHARGEDDTMAKAACRALGRLGDSRGLPLVIEAYREGFVPSVVAESLLGFGVLVLEPVTALLDEQPALAKRSALAAPLAHMPAEFVAEFLAGRLAGAGDAIALGDEAVAVRASAYLKLCTDNPDARRGLAQRLLARATGQSKTGKRILSTARRLLPS